MPQWLLHFFAEAGVTAEKVTADLESSFHFQPCQTHFLPSGLRTVCETDIRILYTYGLVSQPCLLFLPTALIQSLSSFVQWFGMQLFAPYLTFILQHVSHAPVSHLVISTLLALYFKVQSIFTKCLPCPSQGIM